MPQEQIRSVRLLQNECGMQALSFTTVAGEVLEPFTSSREKFKALGVTNKSAYCKLDDLNSIEIDPVPDKPNVFNFVFLNRDGDILKEFKLFYAFRADWDKIQKQRFEFSNRTRFGGF